MTRLVNGCLFISSSVFKENETINAACDDYDNNEKLVFHYASKRSFQCKSIEMTKTGISKPAEWKFQDRLPQWQQIETVYNTEYVFPLVKRETGGFSLDENLSVSLYLERYLFRTLCEFIFVNVLAYS